MRVKSIQYSIQNPCDESWNDMKPESIGRFCGSCEKTVVDFTSMSDFSIVNYLEKHKNEKVCGRFTQPQLDRVYQLNQPVFAQSFDLRAVVLGLALSTFSALHSFAQTEPQEPIKIDTLIVIPPIVVGTVAMEYFDHGTEKKVSGKVWNSAKKFEGVSVILKTIEGKILKTVRPDASGNFEINLNWELKPAMLEFSGMGYETQELHFSQYKFLTNLHITLIDQAKIFKGEIIQGDIKAVEE